MKHGFLKIIHSPLYPRGASFEEAYAEIEKRLRAVRQDGYDGIVHNLPWTQDYPQNDEHVPLLRQTARLCQELGLRLWIYDEKGYPSGAAGTRTLDRYPELEAKALAAVYRILEPNERQRISLPHGHRLAIAACGFSFAGARITDEELRHPPIPATRTDDGFLFENPSPDQRLLCLAFFTKPAFEGTHAHHNAYSERRYIDVAHPRSGKAFIENTYRPYVKALKPYLENGTVEAFFTDEPSYMAVYFNLQKQCPHTTHPVDPDLPLWSMVNWSDELPEAFFRQYGYRIEEELAWLFLGNDTHARAVRKDFYTLLTQLAERAFFQPIGAFCREHQTRLSGHILLEEKITEHPLYEGNFFSLLKHMQTPGMDMLDSQPERVRNKALTPLLVSSISRLYADGSVMDEVSMHFQNKFSIDVSPQQLFNSILLQYSLGANIFTSYYEDSELLRQTPTGESVLAAIHRVMRTVAQTDAPVVALYYPIEAIMEHTVSPIDHAYVWDSAHLHKHCLATPIDRADWDRDDPPVSVIIDKSTPIACSIERGLEDCIDLLLDRQLSPLLSDTASLTQVAKRKPKALVLPPHAPTEELLTTLPRLAKGGVRILALTDHGRWKDAYLSVSEWVQTVDTVEALEAALNETIPKTIFGDCEKVVALWSDDTLLLTNSEPIPKSLRLRRHVRSITDAYTKQPLSLTCDGADTVLTLDAYGVAIVEGLS